MNTISIADLRLNHTNSGNSLVSVNQQLAIGFGVAFGLIMLKIFQGEGCEVSRDMHGAFQNTFLVIGLLTICSGFIFRRLHNKDGINVNV